MKPRLKRPADKYDAYVEHPRYGRQPRHTGLNPDPDAPEVHLHWNATNSLEIQKRTARILGKSSEFTARLEAITPRELPRLAGTAIQADPARQSRATIPVTHYYDVEKICRNCRRHFIFFAEEQKHWYEELRFPLEADCVRCPECRKKEQFLARNRSTYEKLAATTKRDWRDNAKMAGCALTLVEHGIFRDRVLQRVAALLKTIPEAEREGKEHQDLLGRLRELRSKFTPSLS